MVFLCNKICGAETMSRLEMSGGNRRGPPKHQNSFGWKPNSGRTIKPTEIGGSFRPYSEVTGVCSRCKEQIEWKRKYGKYKPLTEPSKCGLFVVRSVPSGMFDKLTTIYAMAIKNACSGEGKDKFAANNEKKENLKVRRKHQPKTTVRLVNYSQLPHPYNRFQETKI